MTIAKKITLGFATPVVLLIMVGLLARSISDRQATTTTWVERSLEIKLNLQKLLARILDAEAGARAFYLVGDDQFLELYRTAQADADRFVDTLSTLTDDNPEQHARILSLTSVMAGRLQVLAENIERRRRAPFDETTGRTALSAGKQAMDAFRTQLSAISDSETALLAKRRADADDTARSSQLVLMAALVLGVLVSLVSSFLIARSIMRPLARILTGVTEISNGNLSHRIGSLGRDELGHLGTSFDEMAARRKQAETDATERMEQRTKVLARVAEIATRLAASAEELAATTAGQAAGAQEQSAAVAETTSIVEEVVQTSAQAAERAQAIAQGAREAAVSGQAGQESLGAATTTMEAARKQATRVAESILSLAEHAQSIEEIITTVDDIAEQSNMLALNAAIEASRAGEYGRGFGVVAVEMKALADASKSATQQVSRILGTIQKQSNQAVMMAETSTRGLDEAARAAEAVQISMRSLADAIANAATASAQIAASARQQSVGRQQVNQAMRDVAKVATQNLATTRQVGQAAQDLTSLGTALKGLFSDRADEHGDGRA
ncbi:hypothetical protein BH11MYX3_BH11MYX3_34190 [soil metagenome]